MTSIRTGPCAWPLASLSCPALEALEYDLDDDIAEMATSFLWNWTGRVFGLCELTIRPCRRDCPEGASLYYSGSGGLWRPVLIGGEWQNLSCGRCGDRCGCDRPSTLRLPGPVDSVTAVTIDGDVLDPSAYRVDNRGVLVRQDGKSWPVCQDVGKPDGEDGTWSVAYVRGVPVPQGGQVAAALLACEMAKAVTAPAECKLPQRIQTITREGVTIGFLDRFEGIDAGHTGIWLVDSWVASVTKRPKRTRVLSPDTVTPRVRTDGP